MNTRERYENDAREKGIPEYMIDGVVEHVMVGRGTGNFLTSLFENDLMKTFGAADGTNRKMIENYVSYMYNTMPVGSWGSVKTVAKWKKDGGLEGLKAAADAA